MKIKQEILYFQEKEIYLNKSFDLFFLIKKGVYLPKVISFITTFISIFNNIIIIAETAKNGP